MVEQIGAFLHKQQTEENTPRVLNIGAGQSLSIEQQLRQLGCRYTCDRVDIEKCRVDFATVNNCWQCSVEDMSPLASDHYQVAFANYVLEHVKDLKNASCEIHRVLAPHGLFATTIPNVLAPEVWIARHTPLWFHKRIRKGHAWETQYSYANISDLLGHFTRLGFVVQKEEYWPHIKGYLHRYPIANTLGQLYDQIIDLIGTKRLMGHVCIVLEKQD